VVSAFPRRTGRLSYSSLEVGYCSQADCATSMTPHFR